MKNTKKNKIKKDKELILIDNLYKQVKILENNSKKMTEVLKRAQGQETKTQEVISNADNLVKRVKNTSQNIHMIHKYNEKYYLYIAIFIIFFMYIFLSSAKFIINIILIPLRLIKYIILFILKLIKKL